MSLAYTDINQLHKTKQVIVCIIVQNILTRHLEFLGMALALLPQEEWSSNAAERYLTHTNYPSSVVCRTGLYPFDDCVPWRTTGWLLTSAKVLPRSKKLQSRCPITGRFSLVARLFLHKARLFFMIQEDTCYRFQK